MSERKLKLIGQEKILKWKFGGFERERERERESVKVE